MRENSVGPIAVDDDGARLEREQAECQANLERLNADLAIIQAKRARTKDATVISAPDRLHLLKEMDPELRSPLHAILGYAQLLRLGGGLTVLQSQWVASILVAGKHLLEKVHDAVSLADAGVDRSTWHIEEEDLGDIRAAGGAGAGVAEPSADLQAQVTVALPSTVQPKVLHVLVVDDIAMNRDIASAFLRAAGHTVATAVDGMQAVMLAERTDFDVILMDVRMPKMDGLEATRRIRALDGWRGRVPIVALTAMAFERDVESCRAAGMSAHLAKPFRFDTLNQAVLLAAAGWHENRAWAETSTRAGQVVTGSSAVGAAYRIATSSDDHESIGVGAEAAHKWIDIRSPWNGTPLAMRTDERGATGQLTLNTQFNIKLVSIGYARSRRLVDTKRSCAPLQDRDQHEFHWLLYTDECGPQTGSFSARCDLWRWSDSTWRNISVPGAHFTPDEMYEHGWRYCGPCEAKFAVVDVV